MGAECYWRDLNRCFAGTKTEQRFKFRHTSDVSDRALTAFLERVQLASHGVGPQIEMRPVPGGNAGPQDDRLGRRMHHAEPFGDVAGEGAGLDHVDEVHRDVLLQPPERAYLLERNTARGTDGAVLIHNGQWLRQRVSDIGLVSYFLHLGSLRSVVPHVPSFFTFRRSPHSVVLHASRIRSSIR